MNNMIRTVTTVLLLLLLLPLSARGQGDTTYIFRFMPQRDMFYVPYEGNGAELSRLLDCVERHKPEILSGDITLYVDGYSSAGLDEADNLRMSRIRSNRVKSELITAQGLTEDCFITRNHSGGGDCVTVRMTVPAAAAESVKVAPAGQDEVKPQPEEPVDRRNAGQEGTAGTPDPQTAAADAVQDAASDHSRGFYSFSLRANLLRWATLTPDLGIEWRISPVVGIMVNGSWTSWSWNNADRRYALWEVAPELRWYMGKERRGYLGAMYKAGQFNYKLSGTGRQGDLMGGGITGGYMWRLNEALSMDFSLGLGYLHVDCEKYEVTDGVRVRSGNETKHRIGPINAGVTLVWRLF